MNSVEPAGTLVYTKLWSNLPQTSLQIGKYRPLKVVQSLSTILSKECLGVQLCATCMPSKIICSKDHTFEFPYTFLYKPGGGKLCKL